MASKVDSEGRKEGMCSYERYEDDEGDSDTNTNTIDGYLTIRRTLIGLPTAWSDMAGTWLTTRYCTDFGVSFMLKHARACSCRA